MCNYYSTLTISGFAHSVKSASTLDPWNRRTQQNGHPVWLADLLLKNQHIFLLPPRIPCFGVNRLSLKHFLGCDILDRRDRYNYSTSCIISGRVVY